MGDDERVVATRIVINIPGEWKGMYEYGTRTGIPLADRTRRFPGFSMRQLYAIAQQLFPRNQCLVFS